MSPVVTKPVETPKHYTHPNTNKTSWVKPAKPSPILEAFVSLDQALAKYKILSSLGHIVSIVKCNDNFTRSCYLLALVTNYVDKDATTLASTLLDSYQAVKPFFDFVAAYVTNKISPEEVQQQLASTDVAISEALDSPRVNLESGHSPFNPLKSLEDQVPETAAILSILDANMPLLKPLLGMIALAACCMGVNKLLEMNWLMDMSQSMIALSKNILAKRVVMSEMDAAVDALLSLIYSAFGGEYINPALAKVKMISNKLGTLEDYLRQYVESTNVDAFGILRCQDLAVYERMYDECNSLYKKLTESEKSNYNFTTRLLKVYEMMQMIRDKRTALVKSTAGKQEPVKVWFAGKPGVGKSRLANEFANSVFENGTAYSRAYGDDYWSGYVGQTTTIFDDILQSPDGKDAIMWHRCSTEASQDVNMADLPSKGTPFTSRLLIGTSNHMYLKTSPAISDPKSFNRRRDYLVLVENIAYESYVACNKAAPGPDWWAENPNRYYLYDPIGYVKFGRDSAHHDASNPAFIGEVTIDELRKMVQEKEVQFAEDYRRRLAKHPTLSTVLTIPEPLNPKPHLFDTSLIFNSVLKNKVYSPLDPEENIVHQLHPPGAPSVVSDDASSVQTNPEAFNLSPVTRRMTVRKQALVLYGEPGCGKTTLVKDWCERSQIQPVNVTLANHLQFRDLSTLNGKFVFVDDFTTTQELISFFASLTTAMDSGDLELQGLIGTGNETVADYGYERKGQINRRSVVLRFNLTTQHAAMRFLSRSSTLEEYLRDKKRDDCITIAVDNDVSGSFDHHNFIQIPTAMSRFFGVAKFSTSTFINHPFIIPFPQEYDYLINMGFPLHPPQYAKDLFNNIVKNISGKQRHADGSFTDLGYMTLVSKLTLLTPLIFGSSAFGSIEDFTAIFNKERHKAPFDAHIICIFADGTLGFMSVPTADGNILVCYKVEEHDSTVVRVYQDVIYVNEQPILTSTENKIFHEAIKNSFTPTTLQFEERIAEEELHAAYLRQETALGKALMHILPIVSVSLQCVGILGFIKHLFSSAPNTHVDEVVPEAKKRRKATTKNLVDNSLQDRDDAAKTPVKVEQSHLSDSEEEEEEEPEAKKRVKQVKKNLVDNSLQDKDDATPTSVKVEAKKRPKKTVKHLVDDSLQDRDDTPTKPVAVEQENDYLQKRKAHIPLKVESVNEDGTIVANGSEEEGYDYGVIYSGMIMYAHQIRPGEFQMMNVYPNASWVPVDIDALPKMAQVGNKAYRVAFNKRTVDATAARSLFGATWTFGVNNVCNIDSVVAFSLAHGIPYDVETGKIHPEKCPILWHPEGKTVAPQYLQGYLRSTFPQSYHALRETIVKEGAQDPQIRELVDKVPKFNKSITHASGAHIVYGTLIGGNKVLTVAHICDIEDLYLSCDKKLWPIKLLSKSKTHDIAIYEVNDKTFPSQKDRTNIFIEKEVMQKLVSKHLTGIPGAMLVAPTGEDGYVSLVTCTLDFTIKTLSKNPQGKNVNYTTTAGKTFVSGVSRPGDCGSLIAIQNKAIQGKVLAIHYAGSDSLSCGTLVTREWVKELLSDPKQLELVNEAVVEPVMSPKIEVFHQFVKCKGTGLTLVGKIKDNKSVHVPTTTRIHRTGYVLPEFDQHEPSIMDKDDPRTVPEFDPLQDGLRRYGTPSTQFTPERSEIAEAFEQIGNEYANLLNIRGNTVRKFTLTEALNGPDGIEYPNSKAIDRSGAAGFPYNIENGGKSKCDYLVFNQKQEKHYFADTPEARAIVNKIDKIIQDAKKDIPHIHPFTAYLKDEPLKLKKIYDVRKTRLFFSGQFEYLMAFRQYFLAAQLRMMSLYSVVPTKVGISPNMPDWHKMGSDAEAVSSHGFASDVENFDSGVPQVFMEECLRVFQIIYARCSAQGQNVAEGAQVREILHKALEGPYVVSRKSLYKLHQSQVSGNPATAIENSLIMWALYYLVWKRLAKLHAPELANYSDFRRLVYLAVYGDDNFCTVHASAPWFNFNTFKDEAIKLGFKITDAVKKGGDQPDYQPLSELSFLKRTFTKLENFWCGPLELASIAKSIMWIRDGSYKITSERVPPQGEWPQSHSPELIAAQVDAAWTELALHGPVIYDQWRDEILKQSGPLNIKTDPPLWKDACQRSYYRVSRD